MLHVLVKSYKLLCQDCANVLNFFRQKSPFVKGYVVDIPEIYIDERNLIPKFSLMNTLVGVGVNDVHEELTCHREAIITFPKELFLLLLLGHDLLFIFLLSLAKPRLRRSWDLLFINQQCLLS